MRGFVAEYDDDSGLGVVEAENGTRHPFHCTQIADGSRTIAAGTAVVFEVAPGHRGQWDALAISPASP
jgi:cold shock CspA family protein